MKFSDLASYFQKIEETSARLTITEILADLFARTNSDEIDKACYLSLGILAPKFKNLNLMLAQKMMEKAISQTLSLPLKNIQQKFKELGDLGLAYGQLYQEKKLENQNPDINFVYNKLVQIAGEQGEGSQDRKINLMSELLRSVDSLSGKFIIRTAIAKLRLGFSNMTIIDALSWSQTGDKSLRDNLETAYNVRADIGQIASIFKKDGINAIRNIIPKPGVPIVPSRATPLFTPKEILEKMSGKLALEPKFDGFRVQIHIDKNVHIEDKEISLFEKVEPQILIKVYSRNLDDITFMFPDLVEAVKDLPCQNAILDGEALAFDPKTGDLLDFQETIKRKRKHNIETIKNEIPLRAYIFDLLLLNNQNLIPAALTARRQELEKVFAHFSNPHYSLCSQKIVENVLDFDTYFRQIADKGLEGLMAKKLDGTYKAGKRDFTWVKYKVGMKSDMADTIDAIVLGYFKGQGKWTQFGLGKVLIGVPDGDKIRAVSKVGSGFSEDKIKDMVERCQKIQTSKMPENYIVDKNLIPDIWVEPEILVEIRADSISHSPLYSTGLSLRFPRFIRFRDDKDITEATSLNRLKTFSK